MDGIIVTHTEFGSVADHRITWTMSTNGVTEEISDPAAEGERHEANMTFAVMPEVAPNMPDPAGQGIGAMAEDQLLPHVMGAGPAAIRAAIGTGMGRTV